MEQANRIDLSALQDGKLHLIAFMGDKFCYLTADPNGSMWALHNTVRTEFPRLVDKMFAENSPFSRAD